MTADPGDDESRLAAFFDAARAPVPAPSDRLVAAVLADAARTAAARSRRAPRPTRRAWGAVAAMAASVALGFGLGLAGPPALLEEPAALLRQVDLFESFEPAVADFFDIAFTEG